MVIMVLPPSPEGFITTTEAAGIADCIEGFEKFSRNIQAHMSPQVEKGIYTFDDLTALQLMPKEVFWARTGDEVSVIDVRAVRHKGVGNDVSVRFHQNSGGYLKLRRSAKAALATTSPFILTRVSHDANRAPEFVDSVSPDAVAQFLVGLAVGPQNRADIIDEARSKELAKLDPQSPLVLPLLMTSFTKYAAYNETRSLYQTSLDSNERALGLSVEVLATSEGNTAYELLATTQQFDRAETRTVNLEVAVAHDYNATHAPEVDISGSLMIQGDIETTRQKLAVNGVIAYTLAILQAAAPDANNHSLRY